MTETPPPTRRSRAINVLIVTLIVIAAPVLVYVALTRTIGPPQLGQRALPEVPPPGYTEVIEIDFAEGLSAESIERYDGPVRLVIEGFGQVAGEAFQDAFYLYTDEDGFGLTPPQPLDGMTINGVPPPTIPRYNPFHVYELPLSVDDTQITITFPPDDDLSDNTGRVQVYVVPLRE
ncbi:MAG: hypothetical protein AAF125_27485 [Chloroflexota bacterium]